MKKKRQEHLRPRKPMVTADAIARDYLGLAFEEMRVARTENFVGTQEDNVFARNKALQSAGMAVELVYKALILGQGNRPVGSGQKGHHITVLHGQLSGTERELLEARIREVGWPTPCAWCRYMDDTVQHTQRKYLMYDPQGQRRGVSFPTHGPASVAGIGRVFDRAFELANRRVHFRRPEQSPTPAPVQGLPDGVEIGPHIATINLPSGFARDGEPLGGIEIDHDTGEIRIMQASELTEGKDG